MGPVVIIVFLPFPQLVVKQMDIVTDAILIEQLIKLLFVDSM